MVTHEEIFSRLGQKLNRTNLYLALGRGCASGTHEDVIPKSMSLKSEFSFPPVNKRCKLTSFLLRYFHKIYKLSFKDPTLQSLHYSSRGGIVKLGQPCYILNVFMFLVMTLTH